MDDDISFGACIGFGLIGFFVMFLILGFGMDWEEWGVILLAGSCGFMVVFTFSANFWLRNISLVIMGLGWTATKWIFLHFLTGNPIDFIIGIILVSFVLTYAVGMIGFGFSLACWGGLVMFPFVFIIKIVRSARGY